MSGSKELMKQAAESIKTLIQERNEFEKQAEVNSLATDIVTSMVSKDMLTSEEVLPKLAELQERDFDELRVFKKALELGTINNMSKLGELSDKSTEDGLSAEEKFVQGVIGDLL